MKTITFNRDNLGGMIQCIAIPPSAIELTYDYVSHIYELTLTDDTDVVEIPSFADGTFSFTESHGRDEHGDWWQPLVAGRIPRHNPDNAVMIETLERGEWVVLCQDGNGMLRLCGDEQTPLTFSTEATTGEAPTDMNSTAFSFTGKLGHPSRFLSIT